MTTSRTTPRTITNGRLAFIIASFFFYCILSFLNDYSITSSGLQLKLYNVTISTVASNINRNATKTTTPPAATTTSEVVYLMNKPIGNISSGSCSRSSNCSKIVVSCDNYRGSCNVNSPMPIHPRPWMAESFQSMSLILYTSNHVGSTQLSVRGLLSTWKLMEDVNVTFRGGVPCESLHSPSILVNEEEETMYMYIHGHFCKHVPKKYPQPTLLFTSKDGILWLLNQSVVFPDLFYLSVPVYGKDGYFYATAKTQETPTGSTILCRSKNATGPFEKGPILAHGMRHTDLLLKDGSLFIFFTMIGDAPERILLGSIDMSPKTNWMDWKFLPGPILLEPEMGKNASHLKNTVEPSLPGAATKFSNELRDPRFIPDQNHYARDDSISGNIFYTVGEENIAMSQLSIDLKAYQMAVRYRNHSKIHPLIYKHSSLERHGDEYNKTNALTLYTGTGRSGTLFLCTLFQSAGINISHDNDYDCGPLPGSDGSASWLDAFDRGIHYSHAIQVLRHPLKVIESRVKRLKGSKQERGKNKQGKFYYKEWFINKTKQYEDLEEDCETWNERDAEMFFYGVSLKHWVLHNSFIQEYASWRENIENVYTDPLAAWTLCMAGQFVLPCPNLSTFREALSNFSNSLNHDNKKVDHKKATNNETSDLTWDYLRKVVSPHNHDYVKIAQDMAIQYGYQDDSSEQLNNTKYECGFRTNKKGWEVWRCYITNKTAF